MLNFLQKKKQSLSGFEPIRVRGDANMGVQRLKLLKGKLDNNFKQRKREIARQLDANKYEAARIAVESCVRDEATMEGYDTLSLMLELLASRVQLIAESKVLKVDGIKDATSACPPELKEVISSILWASARISSDVPELLRLRKALESKFGKQFVQMAINDIEFAVNKGLKERLALLAPANDRCLECLKAIATEYQITSFDEGKLKDHNSLLGAAGLTTGLDSDDHDHNKTSSDAKIVNAHLTTQEANNTALTSNNISKNSNNKPFIAPDSRQANTSSANFNNKIRTPSNILIPPTTRVRDTLDLRLLHLKQV